MHCRRPWRRPIQSSIITYCISGEQDGKCVLVDDVLPDGTVVKKGDLVIYVPYSMGRMPFIWGPDALEFKPERFLKDGVFHSVSPFKFTTFQVLNLILLITTIVNDFHFRETCGHREQCIRLWIRE